MLLHRHRRLGSVAFVLCLLAASPLRAEEESLSRLEEEAADAARAGDAERLEHLLDSLAKLDDPKAAEVLLELGTDWPQAYRSVLFRLSGKLPTPLRARFFELARRGTERQRILAVDACADRRDDESEAVVLAALKSKPPALLRTAVYAARKRRLATAVPALIDLFERLDGGEPSVLLYDVEAALLQVTGRSFSTATEWRSFWEARKGDLVPPPSAEEGHRWPRTRVRARFFGSRVLSHRVVFVLDVSGSMRHGDPPRLERVKREFERLLGDFPGKAYFAVIAYSGVNGSLVRGSHLERPLPPFLGGKRWLVATGKKLQRATRSRKAKVLEWVRQLRPEGKTFTSEAIRRALAVPRADQILLLSDGQPEEFDRVTGEPLPVDQVLEGILGRARASRVRIDTIGMGSDGDEFLQRLAEGTGGSFVSVPE
ncbi:MAG: VWA domain-containing protein [Planctomycetota bacterium]|nr:MAG: VWA domain-containing protein [Planctomycetota bacterium]